MQNTGNDTGCEWAASGHQVCTNKNVKNYKNDKNNTKDKPEPRRASQSEALESSAGDVESDIVLEIILKGGKSYFSVTKDYVAELKAKFAYADVDHELINIQAWCFANPKNRKVDMRRTITNWLIKANDKAKKAKAKPWIHRNSNTRPEEDNAKFRTWDTDDPDDLPF
jgi:hypothetical protein